MKRHVRLAAFTAVQFLLSYSYAQVNLVKNPSFEQIDSCPRNFENVGDAWYWTCLDSNLTSPDPAPCEPTYANICGTNPGAWLPNNEYFYHYPRTGNGLMSLIVYDPTTAVTQRHYLQGRLANTLIAGQSYCVTFYTSMANVDAYAINHIGAYLDDGSIDITSNCTLPQTGSTPQILDTVIIYDSVGWTRVQGNFTANGTERLITIGNFSDNAHTMAVRVKSGIGSYYLIDDVSVIASTASAYAGPDVTIDPGDTAYIGLDSNGEGIPCYWYMLGGTAPIDSGGRIAVHPMDSTSYVVSMDLCGNVTYDTVHVWVNTLGIQYMKMQNVQIFPNPVRDELSITSGERMMDVVVTDVMGRVVYCLNCDSSDLFEPDDKVRVNTSGWLAGVYFVKVNGVVRRVVKE